MKRSRGFSLIELMIVVAITGILSSIAIPVMIRFQANARQSEVKVTLRGWYEVETLYFNEKNAYTELVAESGFSPTDGNRYAYLMSKTCTYQVRSGGTITTPNGANCISADLSRFPTSAVAHTPAPISVSFTGSGTSPEVPGLGGSCPSCGILAVGTANLDNELTGIDTWIISTKAGTAVTCGSADTNLVPGMVLQIKNDVSCN